MASFTLSVGNTNNTDIKIIYNPLRKDTAATQLQNAIKKSFLAKKNKQIAVAKIQSNFRRCSAKKILIQKWTERQLTTHKLNNKEDLLFKIATKEISVPKILTSKPVLESILNDASRLGNLNLAEAVIQNGANLNTIIRCDYPPFDRDTPLNIAIKYQKLDIVKLLIIIDHLDRNTSINSLVLQIKDLASDEIKEYFYHDFKHLTLETIKEFYELNKDKIDSLMTQRSKNLVKNQSQN